MNDRVSVAGALRIIEKKWLFIKLSFTRGTSGGVREEMRARKERFCLQYLNILARYRFESNFVESSK